MYDADPFAAQREVEERQTKAAQKREEPSPQNIAGRSPHVSTEFSRSPEVRMASSLRDTVEDAVKKVSTTFFLAWCSANYDFVVRVYFCFRKQQIRAPQYYLKSPFHRYPNKWVSLVLRLLKSAALWIFYRNRLCLLLIF